MLASNAPLLELVFVFTFVCVPQTFPDFNEIIFCNIGNPQALGLRPMEFPRQVLSMVACPTLIENGTAGSVFPPDAVERAKAILAATASENGMGAYTHSKGLPLVRESIARFIADRDGHPCDPEAVFCTNGASAGISSVMNLLIRDSSDGIMIPIPQYPLYSASLALQEVTDDSPMPSQSFRAPFLHHAPVLPPSGSGASSDGPRLLAGAHAGI